MTLVRRRILLRLVLIAVTAPLSTVANAEPPFINLAFPPSGIVAPREDPGSPHVLPMLPQHAQGCGEDGSVKLEYTIGIDGAVSDIRIVTSSGFTDIDAAAFAAVRSWHYLPATKDGSPLAVRVGETMALSAPAHAPDFKADCSPAGMQAAADAILKGSR